MLTRFTYVLFALCQFMILVISLFGFVGKILVLIVPVPDQYLPFIYKY